jgi:hypothetical protein
MRTVALLLLLTMPLAPCAQAAELFGKVDAVAGTASVSGDNGVNHPLAEGDPVYVGENITTGVDGEVHIVSEDSGLLALRPNSSFRVDRYQARGEDTDEVAFSLFRGALRSITGWVAKRNPAAYQLRTATATIGVRGTDHETTIIEKAEGNDQPGTYDTVYEGATEMRTAQGRAQVHVGEHAFAPHNAAHAPLLLAHRPWFMEHRNFRIEHRILKRREHLREIALKRLERRSEVREKMKERREKKNRHLEGLRRHERE